MSDPDTIRAAILTAVDQRGPGKTLCPSEVARALSDDWRALMPEVRAVAAAMTDEGHIVTTQKGRSIDARLHAGQSALACHRATVRCVNQGCCAPSRCTACAQGVYAL